MVIGEGRQVVTHALAGFTRAPFNLVEVRCRCGWNGQGRTAKDAVEDAVEAFITHKTNPPTTADLDAADRHGHRP